jgi:hypothetical protein
MAFGALILISHKKSLKRKGKVIRSFKSPGKECDPSRVVDALAFGQIILPEYMTEETLKNVTL